MRVRINYLFCNRNSVSFDEPSETLKTSPEKVREVLTGQRSDSGPERYFNPHITAVRRTGDKVVVIFDSGIRKVSRHTYEGDSEEMRYLYLLAEVWARADAILSYRE